MTVQRLQQWYAYNGGTMLTMAVRIRSTCRSWAGPRRHCRSYLPTDPSYDAILSAYAPGTGKAYGELRLGDARYLHSVWFRYQLRDARYLFVAPAMALRACYAKSSTDLVYDATAASVQRGVHGAAAHGVHHVFG
eukprot:3941039-Rhodomonas_salina.2